MAVIDTLSGSAVSTSALDARQDAIIRSGHRPTDSSKIDKGAKEFEAVLLGSWLQQAEASFATVPGGEDEQDVGHDQRMSMGVQALATSMAASGGLGIGRMIADAMHRMVDKGVTTPPTGEAKDPTGEDFVAKQK